MKSFLFFHHLILNLTRIIGGFAQCLILLINKVLAYIFSSQLKYSSSRNYFSESKKMPNGVFLFGGFDRHNLWVEYYFVIKSQYDDLLD